MGVVFESAAFVPCSDPQEVCNELIVPEGGSATFGVRLSEQPTQNVTVNLWKYAHDEIHGNVDAVTVSPTTLNFTSSNYNTLQTVTVTAVADANAGHEHLLVLAEISTTDPIFGNADGQNFVYVTVSDGAGALQVGAWPNVAREAGNGQTSKASMTVWLNRSKSSPVLVSYATEDGTATAGSDYTAVSGTLTFLSGETRKTVDVPILDDNVEDSGETFWLVLSNAQGAKPGAGPHPGAGRDPQRRGAPGRAVGRGRRERRRAVRDAGHRHVLSGDDGLRGRRCRTGRRTPGWCRRQRDEDLTLRAGSGSDLTRVRSGEKGPAVALAVGDNVLVVKTTAGTGVEKTYSVTVTREAQASSSNARTLAGLSAEAESDGTWSALSIGTFSAATTQYAATVPHGTAQVRLTATAADANATLKAGAGSNLSAVTSGAASAAIPLEVGANALSVEVTAEDGTTKTYAVTVTREAQASSSNADLSGLNAEAGTDNSWSNTSTSGRSSSSSVRTSRTTRSFASMVMSI